MSSQVRNRNSEEYNVLKIQLEGIIEELERHFEQVGINSWVTASRCFYMCCDLGSSSMMTGCWSTFWVQ